MNSISERFVFYKKSVDFYVEECFKTFAKSPLPAPNDKIFGNTVWPLITMHSVTPYMVEDIVEKFDEIIVKPGISYDTDDYNFHLSFLYFVLGHFVRALNVFERIPAANFAANLSSWKSHFGLIKHSLAQYPKTNFLNGCVTFNPMPMSKEIIMMLFKWQDAIRYWNDIGITETAYIECLNTLQYTSKVFEHELSELCNRKSRTPDKHDINSMIVAIQDLYPGMPPIKSGMETIGQSNTPMAFKGILPNLETAINGYSGLNEKYGGILFLCRIIRNNSSHELSLSQKMFVNKDEFVHLISILHEGILMVNQM